MTWGTQHDKHWQYIYKTLAGRLPLHRGSINFDGNDSMSFSIQVSNLCMTFN
ncbi:MAG: hypothetical protein IEMM0002_0307 [bacterium]|nr:MAG: hypothetical protein IEMM0002_0307 [bacterium]